MRKICLLSIVAFLAVTSSSGSRLVLGQSPAVELRAGGLARVYESGWMLQDRNDDGQVDYVAARLFLPDSPEPEEVAGAAALAARFGFETSGLSLPLVFHAAEVESIATEDASIFIGATYSLIPESIRRRVRALEEGQGIVCFSDDRVVIAGVNAAGTRAAAEAFASRSPYFWEILGRENGETHQKVANEVARFLRDGGVEVSRISLDELVYEKDRIETVAATFTITTDEGNVPRAIDRLTAVREAHLKGEETERLNYSSVAEVVFRIGDGVVQETVRIPRVGLPQRLLTPPRRIPPSEPPPSDTPPKQEEQIFDLSDFLTTKGIFEDTDRDRIPDSTRTMLVLPSSQETVMDLAPRGTAHLAARIGLESAGMSFPLAKLDEEIEDPDQEPSLILLGGETKPADYLQRLGKRRAPDPAPGRGVVEVVPRAFGKTKIVPAFVVSAGDREGAEVATDYLARRAPYLWKPRRGETTLEDVEESVGALLDGRTAAGQAALALAWLDEIIEDLKEEELEKMVVKLYLEEASQELDRFLSEELGRRLSVGRIQVKSRGKREPETVFEEKPEIEWEVDTFWKVFREKVLPHIQSGTSISVELRVNESPELRSDLAREIEEAIDKAGGVVGEVTVLSAYKQGFHWLAEQVGTALEGKPVARIEVGWKPFPVDTTKEWRFHAEPSRWLNELYPVDEVLAEKLGIPLSAFSFYLREDGEAIYRVAASDEAGTVLYEDSFSPMYYERPYLDAFPDRARVTVTTGWLKVNVDGRVVVDERIPTDMDRVWEHYQGVCLDKIHEHIKESTGGKPTQDKQPFFHTLRFELEASEPDYALGIDQELVTSLESIHDDVYFDTMDFFYEMVEEAEGKPVSSRRLAPGNIRPWIHPERRGKPPSLTVTFSDNASRKPKIEVDYQIAGKEEKAEMHEMEPVKLPRPSAYLVELVPGNDRLEKLGLLVILEDTEPLERLADLLDHLTRLREAGVYTEELSFSGLGELEIRVEAPGAVSTRTYESKDVLGEEAGPAAYSGERLVTWDHVISPEESERIAARLGTLPEVTTYVAGRSYQGRPVSVMEIRLPMDAELVSQAKLSTWKPVLSITGRQHANEVSSTSHILRLAELLAVDPAYRRYLKRMNFVIQPVINPDGAALAYELQKLTPRHCLHAGRYSALGPDVGSEANNPDTLVTEALVLNQIYTTWVPDIELDPHGYPSHEWVHHFANYNPKSFRPYWIPRGWYASVQPIEDPRYPEHQEAARILRDYIAQEVSRDPEVRETNRRIYDRYQRWAIRWQPHVYSLEIHEDTAIYYSRRSTSARRADPRAATTVFSGGTEAMDETAQGEWLDLVSRMGFGYLMASVRFLEEADVELYRLEEERRQTVTLSLTRPRPIKPKSQQ